MNRYTFGTKYYGIYFSILEADSDKAKITAKKYFPQFEDIQLVDITPTKQTINDEELYRLITEQNR